MVHGPTRNRTRRLLGVVVIGMAVAFLPLPAVRGADLDQVAPSLQWIPEDAATYSVMLRNREQLETLLKSKAWAKFQTIPFVQSLWSMAKNRFEEDEGPLGEVRKFLAEPENRQILDLLADMASEEVFVYGGPSSVDFSILLTRYNNQVQIQQMLLALKQLGENETSTRTSARAYLDALVTLQDLIKVPDVVMGFRIKDTARAEAQLKRLETLVKDHLTQHAPQLQGRFQRTKVGKDSFLTLNLDGKLIPWDDIPLKDLEDKPGQYDALIKKISQLTVTFSLGIHDKYVLLALGPSVDPLAKLFQPGQETKRLAGRPEFQPLVKQAAKRIVSINYVSKAFSAANTMGTYDPQSLLKMVQEALAQANLPERQRTQIRKDMAELARDLKKMAPQPGASLSFSFLTNQGSESYGYYYGQSQAPKSAQPLTLLHHLGGNPLMATVWRSRYSPEDYQLAVKWLKVIYRYADELVVPRLEEAQKEEYQKVVKAALPILQRLDEVTGTMLLPALADGQAGLVLDGKLTSKQWLKMLPESEQALPMFEPALVLGVSDPALLRKAMAEYRKIANQALAKAHELADDFPELQIPAPQTKKGKAGELFFYPLPDSAPLDPRIQITLGLGQKVAVIAISQEHADRLLADTPLKVQSGPLADAKRPLEAASFSNWAGLIDVLSPWVEMALRTAEPFVRIYAGNAAGQQDLATQAKSLFTVLKVFRHSSSATYLENGVWVTHSETVIKDL